MRLTLNERSAPVSYQLSVPYNRIRNATNDATPLYLSMHTFANHTSGPSTQPIRVVVAESSRMAGQLVEAALKRYRANFEVQALVGGSHETFEALERIQPNVAIISSGLRDGALMGFKVLQQVCRSPHSISAIMLVDEPERDLVIDAFRTGARAVFSRTHSLTELPDCIRTVYRGESWVSRDQVEFLLEMVVKLRPFQVTRPGALALLTNREHDVVRLVAEGMKNEEISRHLKLTENTVRNYLSHIFDKLGISSRVELVLYTLSR